MLRNIRIALLVLLVVGGIAGAAPKLVLPVEQTGPMTLNFITTRAFDPLNGLPDIPDRLRIDGYDGEYGHYVLQFPGPVNETWKKDIEHLGGKFELPVNSYGFIVRLPNRNVAAVSDLPQVRWIDLYQPVWKILPCALREPGVRTYVTWLFPDDDCGAVAGQLQALGAFNVVADLRERTPSVKFDADGSIIEAIARIPAVAWIENYSEMTPDNVDVQWVDQQGYRGVADTSRPIWRKGIIGDGIIIGLTDTPMWMGHDFYRDPAVPSPGPTHRKVVAYTGSTGSDAHGTHTSGTICGDDSAVGGILLQDGLAKHARLFLQNYSQFGLWDMNVWLAAPYAGVSGLAARNHSMSLSRKDTFNQYVGTDRSLDEFVWNGHRDFLHCNSMGNYGNNNMGHPVASKNIIATGGTENGTICRTFYTTSSRGPTTDGRRRPVLITPASNLYSASNSNPSGVVSMSGTSMATPNMTAGHALIRQYYKDGFYPSGVKTPGDAFNPSAALMMATSVVGADNSMTGYTVPDNNIGWGRLDLDSSLYFAGDAKKLWVRDDTVGLATSDSATFIINIASATQDFRVAMCYVDYPGTPGVFPILINNLDLTVTNPSGTQYKGSVYSGGYSTTGGVYDTLNNQECCRFQSPATGAWQIKVKARNVPQGPRCPYALTVTGDFSLAPIHDVGVAAITSPVGTMDSTGIVPACTLNNYGNRVENYNVRMKTVPVCLSLVGLLSLAYSVEQVTASAPRSSAVQSGNVT